MDRPAPRKSSKDAALVLIHRLVAVDRDFLFAQAMNAPRNACREIAQRLRDGRSRTKEGPDVAVRAFESLGEDA